MTTPEHVRMVRRWAAIAPSTDRQRELDAAADHMERLETFNAELVSALKAVASAFDEAADAGQILKRLLFAVDQAKDTLDKREGGAP